MVPDIYRTDLPFWRKCSRKYKIKEPFQDPLSAPVTITNKQSDVKQLRLSCGTHYSKANRLKYSIKFLFFLSYRLPLSSLSKRKKTKDIGGLTETSGFEPGGWNHVDHLKTAEHKAISLNLSNHCVKILNTSTYPTQESPLAGIFKFSPSHRLSISNYLPNNTCSRRPYVLRKSACIKHTLTASTYSALGV